MPAEYSYFRAEGRAVTAIETTLEAQRELKELKEKLCRHFGANDLMGGIDKDTGRFEVRTFHFRPGQAIPDGWEAQHQKGGGPDGEGIVASFAKPPKGAQEQFYIQGMAGLMERAARLSRLEGTLKSGEMPMKEIEAGSYSGSFVKYRTLEDAAAPDAKPFGQLRDNVTMCFGSNGKGKMSDPIDALKLKGEWYIRVPNKPGTEEPQFTPPDSTPVGFEKMLEHDAAEQRERFKRLQGDGFGRRYYC
ncbi:MAG: hypothetical protein GC185_08270 [Alphaproteobacteria bacterium]|nr:hypothetical protein [Alphaproteobacteria bacterium]